MSVCYLDVQDEITDAVARLRAATDSRVILVLPPGSRIGTSRINFRLLSREVESRGIALDVVSGEPGVRALATSAGLTSYATLAAAERGGQIEPSSQPLAPAPFQAPAGETFGTLGAVGPRSGAGPRGPKESPTTALPAAKPPNGTRPGPQPSADQQWTRSDTGTYKVTPRAANAAQGAQGVGDAWIGDAGAEPKAKSRNRRRGRRVLGWAIRLAILATLIGGVAYGAYLYLPTATISLTPETQPFGPKTFTVTADPNVAVSDPTNGKVPAQRIAIPLAESATFHATGQNVTVSKAQGTLTFTSTDTLFDVPVPQGTLVATADGVQFATTDAIVLPKAAINKPSTVDVGIKAVTPGTTGNVAAATITVVPKSIADLLVTASNAAPTTGGKKTTSVSVTKDDYDGALAQLTQKLTTDLQTALADPATSPRGLTIFPDTAALGRITPNLAAGDLVGQKVDTFDLSVDAAANVLAVDEALVASVAGKQLIATAAQGVRVFPETVTTQLGTGTVSGGTVVYQVSVQARQYTAVDPAQLQDLVRGKTLSEARSILGSYGTVELSIWPDFIPTIPNDVRRINLTIQNPDIPK